MMQPPWVGLYTRLADLEAGSEPIRWLATPDGVYEIRTTPIGTFRVKRPDVPMDTCTEGLTLAIPKMPRALLREIINRFRAALPNERLLNVYWDPAQGGFVLDEPPQSANPVEVTSNEETNPYDPRRPRVLQVHSHGTADAVFSAIDDADEQATGCYGVIGHLDEPIPDMAWRFACGGRHVSLLTSDLFTSH